MKTGTTCYKMWTRTTCPKYYWDRTELSRIADLRKSLTISFTVRLVSDQSLLRKILLEGFQNFSEKIFVLFLPKLFGLLQMILFRQKKSLRVTSVQMKNIRLAQSKRNMKDQKTILLVLEHKVALHHNLVYR